MLEGTFKSLSIDGAQTCRIIGLDRGQLGLTREKGQTINHGNMRKKEFSLLKNLKMSNNGLTILIKSR